MLKVGLTGSIAVGKSLVCEVFAELGASVLDADHTAREVVRAGSDGLREIVEKFGREVLQPDGELDRNTLGAIVFGDEQKRQLLNSIVHPLVHKQHSEWLAKREVEDPNGIAIIDAALMIESGSYKRFDQIIVVWCNSDIQLKRLMLRNNLTEAEALKRIQAQMTQDEKKRLADFLIDTSEGFDETRSQTELVFANLKKFAKNIDGTAN